VLIAIAIAFVLSLGNFELANTASTATTAPASASTTATSSRAGG